MLDVLLKTGPTDSLIVRYLTYSPVLTILTGFLIYALVRVHDRKPFDPYPLIGHLHIFLSRPRWGHLDWFLAASRYHLGRKRPGQLVKSDQAKQVEFAEGLSWNYQIPGIASSTFTSDPACIKYVLVTKSKEFSKTGLFADVTKDMLGEGILVIQGEHWRMQRQAGKIFALPSTLSFVHDIVLPRCLELLLAQLDTAADTGETVDLQSWFKDVNLAVFGALAFNAEPQVILSRLSGPFDRALTSIADRFANPVWPITERLTAKGRKFRRDIIEVKEVSLRFVEAVLEDAKLRAEEDVATGEAEEGAKRPTLVEVLLKAGVEDVSEIVDSCINYTIAGRDTTAHALTWTTYQLLENPSILSDIRSFLNSTPSKIDTLQEKASIVPILCDHLSPLSDLFSESLRLHPPIPTELAQHIGAAPLCLPSGQMVRPGEFVTWSPWVMARLPALWGETASNFDPGRWGRMREAGEKKTVYELPTFHAGPRACLGKDMAKIVMMRTMEALIRRYDIHGAGERKGRLGVGFTGEMEGGLKVKLTKRKGVE